MASIPRSIEPDHVRRVLAGCNRQSAVGRRDYAILLLLARLGLRAGEVAGLALEDIDWEAGCLNVRGKGGHRSASPLPAEVGEAIAAYLRVGRPASTSRFVFLRAKAPIRGFQSSIAALSVVRHALARASIDTPRKGAHQFRHALACEMLRQGASLLDIGQILRHRSPQTTAIYAKVDSGLVAPPCIALAGSCAMTTTLRASVQDYLAMRRGWDLSCMTRGWACSIFVSFMERRGARRITTHLALVAWAQELKSV